MVEHYLGEIRLFGGNYAPDGWTFCAGQYLTIAGNEALYSLIGTAYGGDGRVNFALPDLRGRVAVGAGAGAGLTTRQLGDIFGSEKISLTQEQMPSHKHGMRASTLEATSQTPEGNILAAAPEACAFYLPNDTEGIVQQTMYADVVEESGTAAGHLNMMPWLGLAYIIALSGTYPNPE